MEENVSAYIFFRSKAEVASTTPPSRRATNTTEGSIFGEVAEWLNAHAWKACVAQATAGSNPALTASEKGSKEEPFYSL